MFIMSVYCWTHIKHCTARFCEKCFHDFYLLIYEVNICENTFGKFSEVQLVIDWELRIIWARDLIGDIILVLLAHVEYSMVEG